MHSTKNGSAFLFRWPSLPLYSTCLRLWYFEINCNFTSDTAISIPTQTKNNTYKKVNIVWRPTSRNVLSVFMKTFHLKKNWLRVYWMKQTRFLPCLQHNKIQHKEAIDKVPTSWMFSFIIISTLTPLSYSKVSNEEISQTVLTRCSNQKGALL